MTSAHQTTLLFHYTYPCYQPASPLLLLSCVAPLFLKYVELVPSGNAPVNYITGWRQPKSLSTCVLLEGVVRGEARPSGAKARTEYALAARWSSCCPPQLRPTDSCHNLLRQVPVILSRLEVGEKRRTVGKRQRKKIKREEYKKCRIKREKTGRGKEGKQEMRYSHFTQKN